MRRGGMRRLGVLGGWAALALGAGSLGTGLLAACSSAAHASAVTCGTTRTAAGVPVVIKVTRGTVSCGTALRIENSYAAAIRSGQVRGNGGGAPVRVGGWTCQGFPTPVVLSSGNASQCRSGGTTVLAVLPVPAPTANAG